MGLLGKFEAINPDDVIYNLSNQMLTSERMMILQKEAHISIGLKYYFSPTKLNYKKYFISMKNVPNVFQLHKFSAFLFIIKLSSSSIISGWHYIYIYIPSIVYIYI